MGRGTKSGVENISAFLSLERGEDEFLIETETETFTKVTKD